MGLPSPRNHLGRPPVKRRAAATWLATQRWFRQWPSDFVPSYRSNRREWCLVADGVRAQGLFSRKTSTIDVPVGDIVIDARRHLQLRDGAA